MRFRGSRERWTSCSREWGSFPLASILPASSRCGDFSLSMLEVAGHGSEKL